jgi:hypothetical protein
VEELAIRYKDRFACVFSQQEDDVLPHLHEYEASARASSYVWKQIKLLVPIEKAGGLSWTHGLQNVAGRQRLLLDVLQKVVQRHLLANQTFDGKQLNNLILGPTANW